MKSSLLLIAAALTLVQAISPLSKPPKGFFKDNDAASIERDAYFVTFRSRPGSQRAQAEQAAFTRVANKLGSIKIRKQFNTLLNAVSIEALKQDLPELAKLSNVKSIVPMLVQTPPKVIRKDVNNPALKYSHSITGVADVHENLGFTGKGIKVGVVDSGIDYTHPALGGCFGKSCKVAYGYDFVGDKFNGTNQPVPGGDVRDHCNGHGTHVAGIIAAKDKTFVGVAPEATLGAYRVFGCNGTTTADTIVAAMEKAYIDGMDVINLSLGGGSAWPGYPTAVAADSLAERGVVVVAAMGNDGASGPWEASSPAVAAGSTGIASIDNVRYMANGFTVDGKDFDIDYTLAGEKTTTPPFNQTRVVSAASVAAAVAAAPNATAPLPADLACGTFPAGAFKGVVALVQRGNCTFNEKAMNVQEAGAIGVLIYNHEFGAFGAKIDNKNVTIPVATITRDNGRKLKSHIDASPNGSGISFFPEQRVFDNPTGGKVSSFSSWGPGPELEMKPDLAAPGGLVYSTYPMTMGEYATLSGTSMATPYTAGSIALYLQAKGKKTPPVEIREHFKATANPTTTFGTDKLSPVQLQGGGLINVKSALTSATRVRPAMFPLISRDSPAKRVQTLTITNTGRAALAYQLSHRPALAFQPWDLKKGDVSSNPQTSSSSAAVVFSQKSFRLNAGESKSVTVTFADTDVEPNHLYGGYIVVSPKPAGGEPRAKPADMPTELTLPYSGYSGNYRAVSILPKPESRFPTLFKPTNTSRVLANGTSFSLGIDSPVVLMRLVHPTKHLRAKVLDKTGRELGFVPGGDDVNLGRNGNEAHTFSAVIFNGLIQALGSTSENAVIPADDGDYSIRVEVLRPFGNEKDPRHWQKWDSPLFTINRTAPVDFSPKFDNTTATKEILDRWLRQNVVRTPVIEGSSIENSVLPRPFKIVEKSS